MARLHQARSLRHPRTETSGPSSGVQLGSPLGPPFVFHVNYPPLMEWNRGRERRGAGGEQAGSGRGGRGGGREGITRIPRSCVRQWSTTGRTSESGQVSECE